jgi:L-iditol 2-dehydrogenase
MTDTMKAVVVRAPMQFAVEDVPMPTVESGGLLLRVEACSLCGSDLRTLRSGHRKVTFPWIIGHEICGTIEALGDAYAGPFQPGDRLAVGPLAYCGVCDFCLGGRHELCENSRELGQAWPGGLADYIAIPEACVRHGNLRKVLPDMDAAHAALSEPMSSCINAQEKGEVSLGDTVVIIGSGPIGCLHTAIARARGASQIILVDINQERLEMAAKFQPDALVNASQVDVVTEVLRLTEGKGAEVIVTATPAPQAQVQAVQMARKGARILLFGGLPVEDACPGVNMNTVHYNALHLIGTTTFAPRHQIQALRLLASGRFNAEDLITRFPLSDFATGAQLALQGKILKAVFIP